MRVLGIVLATAVVVAALFYTSALVTKVVDLQASATAMTTEVTSLRQELAQLRKDMSEERGENARAHKILAAKDESLQRQLRDANHILAIKVDLYDRWIALMDSRIKNSPYAKFREAEALLAKGQRVEAQVMAYGAVIDLAGSRDRYCSPGAILVWDNNYGFPQSIREAFFRGGGPYVITEEGLDGRVALEASETTRSCRE